MATRYVDNVSGANGNPGSLASPWKTIAFGVTQLSPGDSLRVITTGTSYGTATGEADFTLTSANSGTSVNNITVIAHTPDAPPTIRGNFTWTFRSCDWWVIDGLKWDDNGGTGGGYIFSLGPSGSNKVSNMTVQNCQFTHTSKVPLQADYTESLTVQYCYFVDVRSRQAGNDKTCIRLKYGVNNFRAYRCAFEDIGSDSIQVDELTANQALAITIEECHFWINRPYGCRDWHDFSTNVGENGVDIKTVHGPVLIVGCSFHGFRAAVAGQDATGGNGPAITIHNDAQDVEIKRCIIWDCDQGISVSHGTAGAASSAIITNCIISNIANQAIKINGAVAPMTVQHCTILSAGIYLSIKDSVITSIKNNVFANSTDYERNAGNTGESNIAYNAWYNNSVARPSQWAANEVIVTTLGLGNTFAPSGSSSLLNAGTNLGIVADYLGQTRDATPALGAMEQLAALATDQIFFIPNKTRFPGRSPTSSPGEYDVISDTNHEIMADPRAKLTTNDDWGLLTFIQDTADHYVAKTISPTAKGLDYTFWIDPATITMASGDSFRCVGFYSGTTFIGGMQLRYSSGYFLVFSIINDAGTSSFIGTSSGFAITDGPHEVRLVMQLAANPGDNDGYLQAYIDGVIQGSGATGIDNDTYNASQLRLGAVNGVDAGTLGNFYLDDGDLYAAADAPPDVPDVLVYTAVITVVTTVTITVIG